MEVKKVLPLAIFEFDLDLLLLLFFTALEQELKNPLSFGMGSTI